MAFRHGSLLIMNNNFEFVLLKVVKIEEFELFQEFNLKFSSPGPGYKSDPVYSPSYFPGPGNSPGLSRNPGPSTFYQSRSRPKKAIPVDPCISVKGKNILAYRDMKVVCLKN